MMFGKVIIAPQFGRGDRAIAMRHVSLLLALAAAGLFLESSSLVSDASAATAGHALAVSVDDFNYIDTSKSPPIRRPCMKSDCGLS